MTFLYPVSMVLREVPQQLQTYSSVEPYRFSAQTVTRLVTSSETDRETRMLFQAVCG